MLKKEWKLWKDLKGKETALGWNASRRTIDASDEWWEERLKIVPAAKKFCYAGKSSELEEKLYMMFGEVVATGEHCWAQSLGKRHSSTQEDEPHVDDDDEVEPISTPMTASDFGSCSRPTYINEEESNDTARKRINRGKAKVGREKHAMHLIIGSLVEETRSIGLAIIEVINPTTQSYTITEVVKELNKHDAIYGDQRLYDFAAIFMLQKSNREMFLWLDEDKRVWSLKNRYQCLTQQFSP